MSDPFSIQGVGSVRPVTPPSTPPRVAPAGGSDAFSSVLRRQLDQVNAMQADADRNVENLLTGEAQNITEVFVAARKAQVAFSLLMEIRNKLVDAYTELRQLRV
ncbi:MAG: flagellar hook-basal body complex protein FliE [Phycisphaerae bacterium]